MNYRLLLDSDSILFKAAYRCPDNIELAYEQFCRLLGDIDRAIFDKFKYEKEDGINREIVFTTGTNFRYNIFPEYKANRKPTPLSDFTKQLKALVRDRLPCVIEPKNIEADDYCIKLTNIPDSPGTTTVLGAIDKDLLYVNKCMAYNYNKDEWVEPKQPAAIEYNILTQAIVGDPGDGIKGCKGVGKVGAKKFMDQLKIGTKSKQDYINLFTSREDCELQNQLVRMHQWNPITEELTLWTLDDWSLITDIDIEDGIF